jgi:signal transduction histidine kinase/ligand-binding sensor domain-containing protein
MMTPLDRPRGVASTIAALGCTLLAWCPPAFALNPALDISQYAHTSWKIRDGFTKGIIRSVTQTPDGYLWLGTEFGLVRFDGVRTVPWQPPAGQLLPSADVWSLLATPDGALWIGTAKGLARWKSNALTLYPELAGQIVATLFQDSQGRVWASGIAAAAGILCSIHDERVSCSGKDGILGYGVFSLYEDRHGTLWAGVGKGFWRWAPGSPTFFPIPGEQDVVSGFDEDDDGTLLIAARSGMRRLIGGRILTPPLSALGQARVGRALRDREGALWVATHQGLAHMHAGRVDKYTEADGLSSDVIHTFFEDREGNVWVATRGGLDRFRDVAVSTVSVKQGLPSSDVRAVVASSDGTIWIRTSGGLARWSNGRVTAYRGRGANTLALFQADRERSWILTRAAQNVRSIAQDDQANLWIADQVLGLLRSNPAGEVTPIPWATFGRKDFATTLAVHRASGALWIGFFDGGVVDFKDGRIRAAYASVNGLGEGRVNSLHVDREGTLWVATEGGLSRVRDGRVATLTTKSGLPCNTVHWAIEDDVSSMWLNTECGLLRVAWSEIGAWVTDGRRSITTAALDSSDGIKPQAFAGGFQPSVVKSRDGRLWFVGAEGEGVNVVDPRHLRYNDSPPPVHIEQMVADRKGYSLSARDSGELRLPALTRDLQIDYTALSLVAPEKMRFRYKLEGHDRDWQDVGTRRQAFYSNLPPRRYRFRVIASNNSGVWNETGATVDFAITPAYYQTTWFPVLCAGIVLGLVWSAHRIRVGIVEQHEREISALNERLMKAQEQERIRIAGELHDGVMQEMLAVTMMLGTAKRRIPNELDAKATIDKVQDKLIKLGTDIRQLSHDLHPPILQEAGLPEAVRSYCEQFNVSSGIPVACDADDGVRDLSRGAALALFRIVQEALGNAAKHAQAKRITVRLTRSAEVVSLVVADDGVGFDPSGLGTSGGLGLVMMRERASQLNGTFEFESASGRGTAIRVVIPFR